MKNITTKDALRIELINAYEKTYVSIGLSSQMLENKAQINASIASIFIAFVFTAITDLKSELDQTEILMIMISFCCLIICIVLSLITLLIQFKKVPQVTEMMYDLLTAEETEFQERIILFYKDISRAWMVVIKSSEEINRFKGACLGLAQLSLCTAVISVSYLTYHYLTRPII